ncbi:MAG: type II secretion system minor pseudopilin GspK [Pararobbsia sp.]
MTVLLVVALAATLAAQRRMARARRRAGRRESADRRGNDVVERAAVEWARAMLKAQNSSSNAAFAGQDWSQPVKDVQLVDLLPRDAAELNGELANAYISGQIEDAQAKFNLMDLVSRPGPSQPWRVDINGLAAYRRLLTVLSLNPALAQATADHMVRSLTDGRADENWPSQLVSPQDLTRVPGYDAEAVKILSPLVTVLPDYTMINANTASASALVAAIPTLSSSQAEMLLERRNTAEFNDTGDIVVVLSPLLANAELPAGALVSTNSSYLHRALPDSFSANQHTHRYIDCPLWRRQLQLDLRGLGPSAGSLSRQPPPSPDQRSICSRISYSRTRSSILFHRSTDTMHAIG